MPPQRAVLDMSTLVNATKLALLLLCAAGYYGTFYMLMNNGTTKHMSHIRDVGPRILPGTNEPLKTHYVGIPVIDYQLTVLALFFWEMVDGSHPAASLFCFHFATQVACGWSLLMIEGLRRGHQWMIISFIGTLGILVQNFAYAVMIPIYLIIYLSTSPLILSRHVGDFVADNAAIAALPISMALGYVIPAILMSLPAPSVITFEHKQVFMAIWQMFPLWVAILQAGLPYLTANFIGTPTQSVRSSRMSHLSSMRLLYTALLVVAGIGQVSTMTLLAISKCFPNLFAPGYSGAFNPSNVFKPAAISPSTKMPSIGSGAVLLLQYDELVGSTSMAVFSSVIFFIAHKITRSSQSLASILAYGFSALVFAGPLGYAVACIWARDELIALEAEHEDKKME